MTKLIISEKTIPLRKIPEEELNTAILTGLMPRISRLLSLTDETSANRLEIALPAIKEHCLGMGFVEIQKMFELYVDGKLDVNPIPNYFDRILLGKIVKSYRSYKLRLKPKIKSEMLKKEKDAIDVIMLFDNFVQFNKLNEDFEWVYTYLNEKNILAPDDDLKKRKYLIFLNKSNNDKKLAKTKAKISILEDYFRRVIGDKKHIKDFI